MIDFPNGWLTIGTQVMLLISSVVMHFLLTRKNPAGPNTIFYAFTSTVVGMVFSAATFFTLTGSFPWQLLAIGFPLALVGFGAVAAIFLAAGLLNQGRANDVYVLQGFFLRKRNIGMTVGLVYLMLLIQFALVYFAFQKSTSTDISTTDGLFDVGLWILSVPTAIVFVLTNVVRGIQLLSRETSRQVRIHALAFSFSHFAVSAWTVGYPWYAFRQQEIADQPILLLMGMAVVIGLFLMFVIIPYYVGRTRFDVKKAHDLGILKTECARLEIATNGTISPEYSRELMGKSFRNLQQLINVNVEDRPVLAEFHERFNKLIEEVGQPEQQLIENGDMADIGPAPQEDSSAAEQADHRLFVFIRANRLVTVRRDKGTLRGVAFETSLECDRWLSQRDGRTALLALLGFAGSAVIPFAARLFETEAKSFTDGILSFIGMR